MPSGSTTFHEAEERLSPKTRDMHRAVVSLMEELEAIDWYQQRVDAAGDDDLRAILAHNRDEEIEHAVMTLEWIRRQSPSSTRCCASTCSPKARSRRSRTAEPGRNGESGAPGPRSARCEEEDADGHPAARQRPALGARVAGDGRGGRPGGPARDGGAADRDVRRAPGAGITSRRPSARWRAARRARGRRPSASRTSPSWPRSAPSSRCRGRRSRPSSGAARPGHGRRRGGRPRGGAGRGPARPLRGSGGVRLPGVQGVPPPAPGRLGPAGGRAHRPPARGGDPRQARHPRPVRGAPRAPGATTPTSARPRRAAIRSRGTSRTSWPASIARRCWRTAADSSPRGGDFVLTVGGTWRPATGSHDREALHLFCVETVAAQTLTPQAVCVWRRRPG